MQKLIKLYRWAFRPILTSRITKATEMRFLRLIAKIIRRDRLRKTSITQNQNIAQVREEKWLQHILFSLGFFLKVEQKPKAELLDT